MQYAGAFVLAMVLMVIPLPTVLAFIRPDFLALLLIYFGWYRSDEIGVFSAFAVGLLFDAMTFGVLGQHALAKVILVYSATRLIPFVSKTSLRNQALIVLALLCSQSVIISLVRLYTKDSGGTLILWLSPLSGALIWFIIALIGLRIKQARYAAIG